MAVSTGRRSVHVILPDELLREIEARVGPRMRSKFIEEAIAEKLNRLQRVEAFDRVVGSLKDDGPRSGRRRNRRQSGSALSAKIATLENGMSGLTRDRMEKTDGC